MSSLDKMRNAISGFPTTDIDWAKRPYFLWDTRMSWTEFSDCLKSTDRPRRLWALKRLLRETDWADIWRLIGIDDLARDLGAINLEDRAFWELIVEVAGEAA